MKNQDSAVMGNSERFDKKNIEDIFALTPMQEGMLYHYLRDPGGCLYFEQLCLSISGHIETSVFERAWDYVVETNEMLRAVYRWENVKEPIQIVLKAHTQKPRYYNFTSESVQDVERRDRQETFDLREVPFRVTLCRLAHRQYKLIISHHHILYDGWSTGIIIREFLNAYRALSNGEILEKPVKGKFREYVRWSKSRAFKESADFWQAYLNGFDLPTGFFPTGKRADRIQRVQRYPLRLGGELKQEIEASIKKQKITLASFMYGAWGILLQHYYNCADISLGTTVSGRSAKLSGIEDMVGLFVNTLPFRVVTLAGERIGPFLSRVCRELHQREAYEDTPLTDIKRYSGLDHDRELFDSIVAVENYPLDHLLRREYDGLSIHVDGLFEMAHYDLALVITGHDGLELTVVHNPAALAENAMCRLAAHFTNIVRELVHDLDREVMEIEMVPESERDEILCDFNNTAVEYPGDQTIHGLLVETTIRSPHAAAAVYEERCLTYRALTERAEALAAYLRRWGVGRETAVGIMAGRSLETIIALVAILRAGGAYLPINSDYPSPRKKYMLANSGAPVLLSDGEREDVGGVEVIDLNLPSIYRAASTIDDHQPATDLAYIMYTSGSTGEPKGVLVTHRNVVRLVKNTNYMEFSATERILPTGALEFDASTFEIWGPLLNGCTLCLVDREKILMPEKLKEAITKYGIGTIWLTSSLFNQMLQADITIFSGLKNLLVGGEALSPPHINRLRRKYPGLKVINGYGPTENTTFSTTFSIERRYEESIPIGRPIANSSAYILNKWGKHQPIGIAGELWVGGGGVSRGYLNSPELTAEKFMNLAAKTREDTRISIIPESKRSGSRLYRTGDLACWLPDGNIEFLGRLDQQVKLRGFRIELAEIESRLLDHPGIREAVVIVRADRKDDKVICAYIVSLSTSPTSETNETSPAKLREYLSQTLPDYMVPAYFIQLERLPLTVNGKIDRRALPEPELKDVGAYTAPTNEIEEKLVEIWSSVLDVKRDMIGVNADFFELGGHSLKAIRVIEQLHREFGVRVSVETLFSRSTIRELARYIAEGQRTRYFSIKPVEKKECYPLSPAQKRLYVLHQMDQGSTTYNVSGYILFSGEFEGNKLERAFKRLICRHEILRTSFELLDGEPVQRIQDQVDFDLRGGDWRSEAKGEEAIESFVQPFDLAKAPLMRAGVMKTGEDKHLLLVDMHHIIADGVSVGIMTGEFAAYYDGGDLLRLRIQYKDYVGWQVQRLTSAAMRAQEAYWVEQFGDEVPLLNLPVEEDMSRRDSSEGGRIDLDIPAQKAARLERLAVHEGASLFMALLAVYGILLSKITGQEDIVVGTPVAGRRHSDLESLAGVFINTLAIRTQVWAEETFAGYLKRVKDRVLAAFDNQDYPFEELVDRVAVERDAARNPLFDVMFVLQNMDTRRIEIPGLQAAVYQFVDKGPKFHLTFSCQQSGKNLLCHFLYDRKLFRRQRVRRFVEYFERILQAVMLDPLAKISAVEIVGESEKRLLLYDFNDTHSGYPASSTIHELFEEQASRIPDRIAVLFEDRQLTYGELNLRANRLGHRLRQAGVMADSIVGLTAERSLELIVGIMSVLKAGGAYLPIDPQWPAVRRSAILADSRAVVWLAQGEPIEGDPERVPCPGIICIETNCGDAVGRPQLNNISGPDHLAYVMYTSGSTGEPKGVLIRHRSVVNLVEGLKQELYRYEYPIQVALVAPYVFDASVKQIFPSLLLGLRLDIVPEMIRFDGSRLAHFYRQRGVVVSDGTPIHLSLLLNSEIEWAEDLPIERFLIGGERLDIEKCRGIIAAVGKERFRITNVYGPTEGGDISTTYTISGETLEGIGRMAIGRPLANTKMYVLGRGKEVLPLGVSGELYIAGPGLARGYLNHPQLTNEKFLPNPFEPGGYLYRTGDLGRFWRDGNLEFLGRVDQQVKIRGYRIEPAEIERELLKSRNIKEAVVIAINRALPTEGYGEGWEKHLCAYVVANPEIDVPALRRALSARLPDYMIPSFFVPLAQIPLTPNGKLDRRALPMPDIGESVLEYVSPRHKIDEIQAEIWAALLGVEGKKIGIDSNFFEMGGHSLKAVNLLSRLRQVFDVAIPLRVLFRSPTIRGLSDYMGTSAKTVHLTVEAAEEREYYPLSSAQKRIWVMQQMDEGSVSYNMPVAFAVEGRLDRDRLADRFRRLIGRHESLRTSFAVVEGEPVQKVMAHLDFGIEYYGFTNESNYIKTITEKFIRPFDLSKAPLLRVALAASGETSHLLMIDMHHIIADGTSRGILVNEFMALYRPGFSDELPQLRLQYKDYSQWEGERAVRDETGLARQANYWQGEFSGELPVLNLPLDFPRPAVRSFKGDSIGFVLGQTVASQLKALALGQNATLYMVVMAIFSVLLSKLSGQADIVVGTVSEGRRHPDLEQLIGMFVKTLAMRNFPDGDKTFTGFLSEVRDRAVSGFENQDYPFEELVRLFSDKRVSGRNPLFDVMFVLENMEISELAIPGLKLKRYPYEGETAKFDLLLIGTEETDGLSFKLEYSTELFTKNTAAGFVEFFRTIVGVVLRDPGVRLSQIEIISEEEKQKILQEFNDTAAAYPINQTIHGLFGEQAACTPHAIAVVSEEECVSYRELSRQSDRLGCRLIAEGVGGKSAVGIVGDRGVEVVIGLLAILKVGGIYVPINVDYPQARKEYLLQDSGAGILLTTPKIEAEVREERTRVVGVSINHASGAVAPTDLAYIIYTSGSTGNPRGVMVTHRNVVRLVKNTNYVEFKPGGRILQTGALEFDASTFEIWGSLLNGLTLYLSAKEKMLAPARLKHIIESYDIDTIWMTAPLFNQMLTEDIDIFAGLTNLLVGGDVLSPVHINRLRERFVDLNVINGYGPTENTTFSTTFLIDRAYSQSIPIGSPIANSTAYIVDQHHHLQPVGIAGELWVGGDGVGRGYLNDPELTAERFVNAAAKSREGTRSSTHQPLNPKSQPLYRTGDLVRFRPDGSIEFLGRLDFQVKVRGFRIELAEIEVELLKHGGIREAVVMARADERGDKAICAYIVPLPTNKTNRTSETSETSPLQLREYLSRALPDYMIPAYFVSLDQIPLTANGKVDRRALPEPTFTADRTYKAPANEIEEKLAAIWSELLSIDRDHISTDANFFELGGHSLKATILSSHIHRMLAAAVPLSEIFRTPTIEGLSAYIKEAKGDKFSSIEAVELREYYGLSSAQKRMYILQQMEPDGIGYNMPATRILAGHIDVERLAATFSRLIRRHESLRTSFMMVAGEPVQRIHEQVNFEIIHYDGRIDCTNIIEQFVRPFDLSRAPLLRVGLARTGDGETRHLLMVDAHHIVSDGASMGIIIRDFLSLYKGKELPFLRFQYKDYARWQDREEQQKLLSRQEAYWLAEFGDEIPVLDLPTDYRRPGIQSFAGDAVDFVFEAFQKASLTALARAHGATPYMLLLTIFEILLSKLSGLDDIVVGTPVRGRLHSDLATIIGMFVNTLALRGYPSGDKKFFEFLNETRESTLAAFENQEYPFEELVEALSVERDASRNPIFDVMFVWQNPEDQFTSIMGDYPGAPFNIRPLEMENKIAKFDLILSVEEGEERLSCALVYGTKLFKRETIDRFVKCLRDLVAQVIETPQQRLSRIEIIPPAEKELILCNFNDTQVDYPRDKTIHRLLEEQTAKTPDYTALVDTIGPSMDVATLTYRELNVKANRISGCLRRRGIAAQNMVAMVLNRSSDMVAVILGILKSGGVYLPIDPDLPADRIQYMLAESGAGIFISKEAFAGKVAPGNEWLDLEASSVLREKGENPDNIVNPTSPAYCIYTSGTTGSAKGTLVAHYSLVNLCLWHNRYFGVMEKDQAAQYAGVGFDASIWEIFPYMIKGARLHIIADELKLDLQGLNGYFETHGITIGFLPTQMCEKFMEIENGSLRLLLTGGDKLRIFRRRGYAVYNNYGPTENTVVTTSFRVVQNFDNIPIGAPIDNNRVYILSLGDFAVQPLKVPGELCVSGDSLSRGYLNQPELTQEKFIMETSWNNKPLYRSGDLARWLPEGHLEFLGRIDQQVKIRGYRIEPGEVESHLLEHQSVEEAVVVTTGGVDKRLAAYVVLSTGGEGDKKEIISALGKYLSGRLPGYMIPSYFVMLERIPLTANGKLDRRALPEPEVENEETYAGPRNLLDERLAEIWSEVLGVTQDVIGIDSDFFKLGGHSLKAVALASRLHKSLNVKVPLGEIFQRPTIRELAGYLRESEITLYQSIQPVEKKEYYPVSSAQRRLFVVQRLDEASTAYNMPLALELSGQVHRQRLESTFRKLIARHGILRTSFELMDGEVIQRVHDEVGFGITDYESSHIGSAGIVPGFVRPFDLSAAPLLRVGSAALGPDRHLLLIDMHHIVSDGTSAAILTREFTDCYGGRELPSGRVRYIDYAQWQQQNRQTEAYKAAETYWLSQFADEVPNLDLPADVLSSDTHGQAGGMTSFGLPVETAAALNRLAIGQGVSLFMVLLAVYFIFLSKLSGQDDIVVGTPVAGRGHADLEPILGVFINTLAIRSQLQGHLEFSTYLITIKEITLKCFENQDYPFEDLVEAVVVERDIERHPLFDVMFVLENMEPGKIEIPGLKVSVHQDLDQSSKYHLTLFCEESDHKLAFSFRYDRKLFTPPIVDRLVGYFENIVAGILAAPSTFICDLELLSPADKNRLLYDFNDTAAEFPSGQTIHRLFEEQVARCRGNTALVFAGCKTDGTGVPDLSRERLCMTYEELNQKSNRLAGLLKARGAGRNDIVALMTEPSAELVVGILGIVKAGAAYLPIDPENPEERIGYMLSDSQVSYLMLQGHLAGRVDFGGQTIYIDDEKSFTGHGNDLEKEGGFRDPVYTIYTSGTTGRSKGVLLRHENLVNYVSWFIQKAKLTQDDRSLLTSSFGFDLGYTSIYPALLNGCELHLMARELYLSAESLLDYIDRFGITYMKVTPSLFSTLIESPYFIREKLDCLRLVVLGGEAIRVEDVERAHQICGHLKFMNHYGPTESTIGSVARFIDFDVFASFQRKPVIGRPVSNTGIFIFDRYMCPVPEDVAGEICIGGHGLSLGYLNRPELTLDKFVAHPYRTGESLYRTGDLGRWTSSGEVEFLGRLDQQVKIRGFRIELGEIEARVLWYEGVKDAVVVDRESRGGDRYLCAYYVGEVGVDIDELQGYLSRSLPNYMVPSYFISLERIPLTPNGKLDRRALPEPEFGERFSGYAAPRDEIDVRQLTIWSELLGIEKSRIGIDTNFFEIGGHSLKAINLLSRLHKFFNVKVPLAELFQSPTIRGISDYIRGTDQTFFTFIEKAEKRSFYPLSSAQKRIFIMQQMDEGSVSYNMPVAFAVEGRLDRDRLADRFCYLIGRHESLRTSFAVIEGEPVQKVMAHLDFEIEYYGFTNESNYIKIMTEKFIRTFDLSKAPLLRVGLAASGETSHLLMIDMHHIIADGTSRGILVNEFMALYRPGFSDELPQLRLQYKDYSQWEGERAVRDETGLVRQANYWQGEFSGELPVLNLPLDFPRPAVRSFKGDSIGFVLGQTVASQLKALALGQNATLYMVVMAIFSVLLSKLSGQEDIVVGTVSEGRRHPDLEQLIGMFVNTLALRDFPVGEKRFTDFLAEVKEKSLAGFENQDYQFEELVGEISERRAGGRNPLFDVMFVLENISISTLEIPGLTLIPYPFDIQTSKFDLTLVGTEFSEGIHFVLEYRRELFKRATVERFVVYFEAIVNSILKDPHMRLSETDILSLAERDRILNQFNDTAAEFPSGQTIHRLFETQVSKAQGNTALVFAGCTTDGTRVSEFSREKLCLTYEELNQRSNRLAGVLKVQGVGRNDIAALMTEPSAELVVGILGILKAGAAYLPIDPENPEERIGYMLEDSQTTCLLLQGHLAGRVDFGGQTIYIDDEKSFTGEANDLEEKSDCRDPVYTIYTSGTTGRSKGVLLRHENLVNYVSWFIQKAKLAQDDRSLLTSSFGFDLGYTSIYPALLNGCELHLMARELYLSAEDLLDYIDRLGITYIKVTPSLFSTLIESPYFIREKLGRLRLVVLGGEAIKLGDVERAHQICSHLRFMDEYGPTESTIGSIARFIDIDVFASFKRKPVIGRPVSNTFIFIVDRYMRLVPEDVVGEICIGGQGLGLGYLNRPELTLEKFMVNPYRTGELMYCTGDLGRWTSWGEIEFLGRLDQQVKIRGFRIELGEIEARVLRYEGIRDAVVVDRESTGGGRYLCAYYVGEVGVDIDELQGYLSRSLPNYMVPSYFVSLDQIPLTPNGKLDRRALPEPEVVEQSSSYRAPRNEIDEQQLGVWSELLGIEKSRIGIDANFFEIGGHSLKAVNLLSRLQQTFQVKVPLSLLFEHPTIRGISDYIKGTDQTFFTFIEKAEKKSFYPLSSAQKRIFVMQQMDETSTSYNMPVVFEAQGRLDHERLQQSFFRLIVRHESLRTSFEIIDGEPAQRVHDEVEFEIEHFDLGQMRVDEVIGRFIRPFDLSAVPLLRVGLAAFGEGKHLLFLDMHHIVVDGRSRGILIKEFTALYKDERLDAVHFQYKDYSCWQSRKWRNEAAVLKLQGDFWRREFCIEPPELTLPYDYARPIVQSFRGASVDFRLGVTETEGLRSLGLSQQSTLYMVILAIFNVLMSKLSGQEDIVVGTVAEGRRHWGLEGMVGMFVDTLAVRNYPCRSKGFIDFLKEVREKSLLVFENQDFQFEELVGEVSERRASGRNPLFDVMFVLENLEIGELRLPEVELRPIEYDSGGSKFDLLLAGRETTDGLFFEMEYRTELFRAERVKDFVRYFEQIASTVLRDPDQKIAEIDVLSIEERKRMVYGFNDTGRLYTDTKPIHYLFDDQVGRTPNGVAVVCGDVQLSYREFNLKSSRLACVLRARGVKPNTIVGVMISGSEALLVGIYGTLKAGGAYLPIDRKYPPERKSYMLWDSGAQVLLLDGAFEGDSVAGCEAIDVCDDVLYREEDSDVLELSDIGDLVYVIYTSGSTGRPKAAGVFHRGFSNLVSWYSQEFGLCMRDRAILMTSISFDLTQKNIYAPLLKGGTLFMPKLDYFDPAEVLSEISQRDINWINCTPGMLYELINFDEGLLSQLSCLRYVFLGGEPIVFSILARWVESEFFNAEIVNTYGPTECTDVCSYYRVKEPLKYIGQAVPIGFPISNVQLYVLDKGMDLVVPGVVGELYVSGIGVGLGYLNGVERTESRFVSNPFSLGSGLLYRTGDLVKWSDKGIEFLGRVDHQVKIRGFRIELGEIEAHVMRYEGVKEAVVVDREGLGSDRYLCAYYVAEDGIVIDELRDYLSCTLPHYMVPSYFVSLDQIPLTPNGKLDRRALPEPEVTNIVARAVPRNELEEKLVRIWSEVLGVKCDGVSIDSDFFMLGGHSLKAVALVSRLHKELNVKVPLGEIFQRPTIREFSGYLKELDVTVYRSIQPVEKREYYPVSSAQKRMFILNRLKEDNTSDNTPRVLAVEGSLERDYFETIVNSLIRRHETLRTSFELINDEPVQRIYPEVDFEMSFREVENNEIKEVIQAFIRPFDLARAPLLRVELVQVSEESHFLLYDIHHIITDDVSDDIFLRDFIHLYKSEPLPRLRLQYKDYAYWQNDLYHSGKMGKQESYWLEVFMGRLPVLNMPTDYPRPMAQSFEGDYIEFKLSQELSDKLNRMASETGATLFMILLSVYYILLSKICGQEDIIVGIPIAGRPHSDLENIVGFFVNTLAFRNFPKGEKRFLEFLEEVKINSLKAYENQDYQFDELVAKLNIDRDSSRHILFDTMFNFHFKEIHIDRTIEELTFNAFKFKENVTQSDFMIHVIDGDGIYFKWVYCTKLFYRETIERLGDNFEEIAMTVADNMEIKLKDINIHHGLANASSEILEEQESDFRFF